VNAARSVLIFGGARGIGAATAEWFAAGGDRVLIADQLTDQAEATATVLQQRGHDVAATACDVADDGQVVKTIDDFAAATGRLDVVLNNVGVTRHAPIAEMSVQDWDYVYRVNVRSQFISARTAIPWMLQAGGGVIVNTASILAHAHQRGSGAYSSSKAAVMAFTRAVAIDYADRGIRCVSVSPGTIDTPLVRTAAAQLSSDVELTLREWGNAHPVGRMGQPEEVAAAIHFLASPEASFITGCDLLVDGGIRAGLYN
jgi:NAD(P)-dependent dehydrogenase (short-subunit alcohol dehydrogenase family)